MVWKHVQARLTCLHSGLLGPGIAMTSHHTLLTWHRRVLCCVGRDRCCHCSHTTAVHGRRCSLFSLVWYGMEICSCSTDLFSLRSARSWLRYNQSPRRSAMAQKDDSVVSAEICAVISVTLPRLRCWTCSCSWMKLVCSSYCSVFSWWWNTLWRLISSLFDKMVNCRAVMLFRVGVIEMQSCVTSVATKWTDAMRWGLYVKCNRLLSC